MGFSHSAASATFALTNAPLVAEFCFVDRLRVLSFCCSGMNRGGAKLIIRHPLKIAIYLYTRACISTPCLIATFVASYAHGLLHEGDHFVHWSIQYYRCVMLIMQPIAHHQAPIHEKSEDAGCMLAGTLHLETDFLGRHHPPF